MRQFTENQEVQELLCELDNNDVQYEVREYGKVFIDVLDDNDELEGIFQIKYEPHWGAYKVIYHYFEDNEIKSAKTVAWDVSQILEDILG